METGLCTSIARVNGGLSEQENACAYRGRSELHAVIVVLRSENLRLPPGILRVLKRHRRATTREISRAYFADGFKSKASSSGTASLSRRGKRPTE